MSYTPPTPLQPDKNPNRGFRWFALSEIWTGPSGTGSWIPNPGDLAIVPFTLQHYLCQSVDYISGHSVMVPVNQSSSGGASNQILIGSGPGSPSQAYKCYINTTALPYTLQLDAQLYLSGPDLAYAKVFAGNDTSDTGTVVSAVFDSGGNLISENLPMQLVADQTIDNVAVQVVAPGHASQPLLNGSSATIVIYTNAGVVAGIYSLTVVNTNSVRSLNPADIYITGIELITPFISPTNANEVDIPVNLTLQSAMFRGKAYYSNGSSTTYAVDGTKFTLIGLNSFLATIPNQTQDLVLKYSLANGELANEVTGPPDDLAVTRRYTVKVLAADNALTVKIFAVLWWDTIPSTPVYRINYYLYMLDRNAYYDITSNVQVPPGRPAFDGSTSQYGNTQTLQISVNLKDVVSSLPYYYYSEVLQVTTQAPAGLSTPASYATMSYNGGTTVVGQGSFARYAPDATISGQMDMYLSDGFNNLTDWLNAHYYNMFPLFVSGTESAPPAPTHVRVKVGTQFYQLVPIANIMTPIPTTITSPQGQTVRLEYIQVSGSNTYELAIGGMILKNTV